MMGNLLEALEASDVVGTSELFRYEIGRGRDPYEIHLSLFPVVMRVLNPPFVNAHLPKMYSIYRDLIPYLNKEEITALIQLEINEYARRPLLDKLPRANALASSVSFSDIESAIREQDWEKATILAATFCEQKGKKELSCRFLLLGSGYLDESLGHSVSVSAFILLEMMERKDEDPWPALATLSYFFCKSQFHTTPSLLKLTDLPKGDTFDHQMMRATSGKGIMNLHDPITRYAIERTRQFFNQEEYQHMFGAWSAFMRNKTEEKMSMEHTELETPADYSQFNEIFSRQDARSVVGALSRMILSRESRRQIGRFLIKGLCDQYQGRYDPHYLTGLGATLWVVERYWDQSSIALDGLFQYLDFYFESLKSRK